MILGTQSNGTDSLIDPLKINSISIVRITTFGHVDLFNY